MMNTPVCDFVRAYAEKKALRLHMPGHKGLGPLGIEALDITEIEGADSLFEADGILRESEENASALFGCPTFYSTEGSSLCIRAMLYLSRLHALSSGRRPLVLAGRNAHKTFLSALALLDIDVEWLYPAQESSYLACPLDTQALEQAFAGASAPPGAVYITSPDYLGHVADIAALAEVCHRHGALLLVDNAHGAYLRFLPESMHPMDLGADLCCDSAHKTLPVLTGGAYLHIARHLPALAASAKDALALFGSTSPSYLLLQSLDAANPYLEGYPARLRDFCGHAARFKDALRAHGYQLIEEEPLKATILARAFGYSGRELADVLLEQGVVCEFSDPEHLVMMFTPETGREGLLRAQSALCAIERRAALPNTSPALYRPERVLSPREAALSPSEVLPVERCLGRVLALATVGCPPAVPILVSGERIDERALERFAYYGVGSCRVVRQ